MRRPIALLCLAALVACQDYQFTPVGRCLLQPGRASVQNTASTVDILFVVDDSFSMDPIQDRLAMNLKTFITRLAQRQQERVRSGGQPFDFYIAVTSSSVMVNKWDTRTTCSAGMCSIASPQGPPARSAYSYSCTGNGACGDVVTHYYNSDGRCLPGVMNANGDPYPAGALVAKGTNPKVLAFTHDLNWSVGATDPTIATLITQFEQNVHVGSCGANQEMPLEAARRAIDMGIRGQQRLPANVSFPHAASKIAVIFVTDEDDCSTAAADRGGLVWDAAPFPDTCARDADLASPVGLTPHRDYVGFLTQLERPVAAAFVRPGMAPCALDKFPGKRLSRVATDLKALNVPVVEASVCGDFAGPLEQIADALPPPDKLQLPTAPAAGVVTQIRVQRPDGTVVHVCDGPDQNREWWFVDCQSNPPAPKSAGQTDSCIAVKPNSKCVPAIGETLQAEYLGRVPAEGCTNDTDCATKLGGGATAWRCEGASSAQAGTCVCSK